MCGTHDHQHADEHAHEHAGGHEHGQCGHCNHEGLSLEELKRRRDRLDRDIAALELERADATRLARTR